MVEELKKQGGYLCNPAENKKLESWMWVANAKIIAVSAHRIAEGAGIAVPDKAKMLMGLRATAGGKADGRGNLGSALGEIWPVTCGRRPDLFPGR